MAYIGIKYNYRFGGAQRYYGGGTPNGVATDNTYVYWAEGTSPNRGIYRALLDGSSAMNLIPQSPGSPLGVAVIPVPEPTSMLMVLLVSGGICCRYRDRSRQFSKTTT